MLYAYEKKNDSIGVRLTKYFRRKIGNRCIVTDVKKLYSHEKLEGR